MRGWILSISYVLCVLGGSHLSSSSLASSLSAVVIIFIFIFVFIFISGCWVGRAPTSAASSIHWWGSRSRSQVIIMIIVMIIMIMMFMMIIMVPNPWLAACFVWKRSQILSPRSSKICHILYRGPWPIYDDHDDNDVSVKVVKVVCVLHIPAVCLSKSKDDDGPQN